MLELLKKSYIFSSLDYSERRYIARYFRHIKCVKNQVVCRRGEPGSFFALIENGKIKISALSEFGKDIVFAFLESGDFFGEMSLFGELERAADAVAINETDLFALSKRDIMAILRLFPSVAMKILEIMALRLKTSNEKLEEFASAPLKARLISFLKKHCERVSDCALEYTHCELAEIVGGQRETISRLISELKAESILKKEKGVKGFKIDFRKIQEKYEQIRRLSLCAL